ncbi:hypothetical protein HC026_02080 [Lactobacillus sp. LC28-10]|uniref:DUF5776 domain-containing protein n=1 Tax=Secundilactobacillus angelensis TaxID=2722706 RepID=A0ABX1KXG8_9LACO|nr:GH25 family lysozyme [Secundilactobacillus angelensis]MCH5461484.1 DUF5776 domain-containing protein [Secundilactobacillus angelensis]NLR17703.1 hypothetical protein [Secundilactobacillus angelensis]
MAQYFIDTASYQPQTYSYFLDKRQRGAKGVVVKTSEGGYGGTPYVNGRGHDQVINAKKAGLKVALYHYARFNSVRYGKHDPASEADLMVNTARSWGLGKDTLMVLDAEDPSLRHQVSTDAALFFNELKRRGFKHFDIYGPGSWFWARRLKIGTSYHLGGWPASYGSSSSGVSGAKAWQYTDNWKGLGVDGSLDYGGQYTTAARTSAKPKKMTKDNVHDYYFTYNPGRIITKTTIYQHKTGSLKSKSNRALKLPAGTAVDIKAVHTFSHSVVPYFELANHTYITASREAVTNAFYESSELKAIKVIKRTNLYHDLQRTKVVKRKGLKSTKWPVGTPFTVNKVIPYKGAWILKLDNGFYCTAYKQYVKKIK